MRSSGVLMRRRVTIVYQPFVTDSPRAPSHLESTLHTAWLSFLLGLLTLEDGIDMLSRNVGKQLSRDAA
jgi:hypothetical protein